MSDPTGDDFASRLENPRFWEELQETFETAIDLLQEIAEAQGIDVAVPGSEDVEEEERRLDETARGHALVLKAGEYAEEVDIWFRDAKEAVLEWGVAASRIAENDGLTPDVEAEADDLQEAIETVADARYRISVKLIRAIRCRMRDDSEVLSSIPGASEKAAAEAYVLVEDSIRHWMRLREIIPSEEDAILRMLVHLGSIRDGMEREFTDTTVADTRSRPS